ncbi:hypothetical protein VNI00_003067 [Paramarasmius palmivorus]|uniref:Uncharacterized protein n=1 Tax=Paramarasmius palmivorus TaxID=297713 RepID=A0AAW0DXG8_9AGAR
MARKNSKKAPILRQSLIHLAAPSFLGLVHLQHKSSNVHKASSLGIINMQLRGLIDEGIEKVLGLYWLKPAGRCCISQIINLDQKAAAKPKLSLYQESGTACILQNGTLTLTDPNAPIPLYGNELSPISIFFSIGYTVVPLPNHRDLHLSCLPKLPKYTLSIFLGFCEDSTWAGMMTLLMRWYTPPEEPQA